MKASKNFKRSHPEKNPASQNLSRDQSLGKEQKIPIFQGWKRYQEAEEEE